MLSISHQRRKQDHRFESMPLWRAFSCADAGPRTIFDFRARWAGRRARIVALNGIVAPSASHYPAPASPSKHFVGSDRHWIHHSYLTRSNREPLLGKTFAVRSRNRLRGRLLFLSTRSIRREAATVQDPYTIMDCFCHTASPLPSSMAPHGK